MENVSLLQIKEHLIKHDFSRLLNDTYTPEENINMMSIISRRTYNILRFFLFSRNRNYKYVQ